jgi:hypothetical protein
MLKCPVCSADLAKLAVFPDACPVCGYKLNRSTPESASVQLISDAGEPRSGEIEATLQSDEGSLLPARGVSEFAEDDPHHSKTFVSDEWNDPAAPQSVQSKESSLPPTGESASLQLISDSGEPRRDEIDATLQSNEASLRSAGSSSENAGDDPSNSRTFVSDEWDDPANSQTVQSGEFDESPGSPAGRRRGWPCAGWQRQARSRQASSLQIG